TSLPGDQDRGIRRGYSLRQPHDFLKRLALSYHDAKVVCESDLFHEVLVLFRELLAEAVDLLVRPDVIDREGNLNGHLLEELQDHVRAYEQINRLREQLAKENEYLVEEIRLTHNFGIMVGKSQALQEVVRLAETVAPTNSTVLISGETGTGKELLARAIHERSARRDKPFVRVNCAALPQGLVESELFGHERGAFTGANQRRQGRFELADGGTLFLDEISELPLEAQAKLLRVLQDGLIDRVGGRQPVPVDVRIITATNSDLGMVIAEERFRPDLFYRLNVFPIAIPAL